MPDNSPDNSAELIRQAMSALARRRWAGTTAEQRQEHMAKLLAKRRPGAKRNLTAEQREAIGKRLTAARAAKRAKSV